MGGFSPIHLLVLAVVAILLLGGGRFSSLMGDVAKGVKNFKKGMAEEDRPASTRIEAKTAAEPAFDRDGDPLRERAGERSALGDTDRTRDDR
ncbi:Sec-independent protein translocase TatA [Sphingomonas sp.]|uniref:Sec-independent protein translocase TatA n=1 Tax=Sphingomonas sp. TaxID=28214 RepID=UPI0035BC92C2